MKDKIMLSKSIIYDYFTLQKNNEIPFYFKKEDLEQLITKLNELNEEISYIHQRIKIYCYECDAVLEILESNTCYCHKCDEFFSEDQIRTNCGV